MGLQDYWSQSTKAQNMMIKGATPPLSRPMKKPKKVTALPAPIMDWQGNTVEVSDNPCVNLYGKDPQGRLCKQCNHMYEKHYDKVYWKCELRADTNGPGTDHRRNWPACKRFEEIQEEHVT